jgi:hypothetical protein
MASLKAWTISSVVPMPSMSRYNEFLGQLKESALGQRR